MSSSAWITTYGGRRFYVLDPRVQDVAIEDIAHSLSLQCRFSGHVREFYSVAQHSVLISRLCTRETALWGLLHDASEAYIGDMSAPLKHTPEMSRFRDAERHIMNVIIERFSLSTQEPQIVRDLDRRMLLTEARDLGLDVTGWYKSYEPLDQRITSWAPKFAEERFLEQFNFLTGGSSSRFAVCQADGYVDEEADCHGN